MLRRVALGFSVCLVSVCLVLGGCALVLGFEDTTVGAGPGDGGGGGPGSDASGDAGPPGLSATPLPLIVRRGGQAALTVLLQRGNDITGTVNATLEDLPTGVTATSARLDTPATTGTITASAATNATLGPRTAHLRTDGPGLPVLDVPMLVADPSGSLDVSFDADGLASDSSRGLGGTFYGLALQGDGKIVAGGVGVSAPGWMVKRLLDNGSPDTAFNGLVTTVPADGELRALALDANGKILCAGSSTPAPAQPPQLTVVRLLATGAIDATFASGGTFRLGAIDGINGSIAYAIAVQADGAIIVAGSRKELTADETGIALRLTANGARDTPYGLVTVGKNRFVGATIDKDGVVLAGTDASGALPLYFLTRRNAQGKIDPAYGAGGTLAFGLGFRADGAVRLPSGEVALVGESAQPGNRYTAGVASASGAQVWVRGLAPGASAAFYGAATQADGRILAAGHTTGAAAEARVDRILSDGGRDDSFGDGGTAFLEAPDAGTFSVTLFAAAAQPDGRVVVAGNRSNAGAVVYRLWP